MKNLQNLKGAKALNKKEQQVISGGGGELACQDAGGTWTCIGTEGNPLGACGCVFDAPDDPPIQ